MKETELFIYDIIGEDWWSGNGVTAKGFAADFRKAEAENDIINIRINSPGGSVFDGIAIYNLIAQSKKEVHTYIDGIAYSMAAIIALAGKKVYAAKNSTLMIHAASGWAVGNVKDIESALEMMKALDNSLAISIAEKTGQKVEDVVKNYFDYKDHTLSASDALEQKLIDEVLTTEAQVPKDILGASVTDAMAYFAKHPSDKKEKSFLNTVKKIVNDFFEEKNPKPVTPKPEDDMKIKITAAMTSLAATLGVDITAGKEVEFDLQASHVEKIEAALVAAEKKFADEHVAFEAFKKEPGATGAAPVSTTPDVVEEAAPAFSMTSVDKEAQKIIANKKALADVKLPAQKV